MTDKPDVITENQRLRNELLNIRRLEYVIPNAPADVLILKAVTMARNALEPAQEA
jgi:hypothetical protein